jgi:hypothetical protein
VVMGVIGCICDVVQGYIRVKSINIAVLFCSYLNLALLTPETVTPIKPYGCRTNELDEQSIIFHNIY